MLTDEFDQLANEAAQEELSDNIPETKKDLWIRMGTLLEAEGTHPRLIPYKIQVAVEKKIEALTGDQVRINTAHFYRVMREKKWVTRSAGGTKSDDNEQVSVNPLGGKEIEVYIENLRVAKALEELQSTCQSLANTIRGLRDPEGNYIDIGKHFTKAELDEFLRDSLTVSKVVKDAADNKTLISQNSQVMFRHILNTEVGMINIAKIYLTARIKLLDIVRNSFMSKKQVAKYRTGDIHNPLPILQPKNRDEAIFMGYYGVHCRQCKSWRVKPQTDANAVENLVCLNCNNSFQGLTISHCSGQGSCGALFYCEEIKFIKKNKKCPDCGKSIPRIPQHMDNYCKD